MSSSEELSEESPLWGLCHCNQNSAWNGNLLAALIGDLPSIIPVKFGEILPSGLGFDVVERKC